MRKATTGHRVGRTEERVDVLNLFYFLHKREESPTGKSQTNRKIEKKKRKEESSLYFGARTSHGYLIHTEGVFSEASWEGIGELTTL